MAFLRRQLGKLDSKLKRLDGSLQSRLDNGFAKVLGGSVVPADIEERLKDQMSGAAVPTAEGYTETANLYLVAISSEDFASLAEHEPNLPEKLADLLTRYARNNGWLLPGPVAVTIEEHERLSTGQIDASCSSEPGIPQRRPTPTVAPAPPVAPPPPAEPEAAAPHRRPAPDPSLWSAPAPAPTVVPPVAAPAADATTVLPPAATPHKPVRHAPTVTLLLQDGSSRTYLLQEGSTIIGRGHDADFRLPDTGVSRTHAEITWDGRDAILADLHSTNGTVVNGIPVDNWLLADGDVITVGHSYIEVRIVGDNGN